MASANIQFQVGQIIIELDRVEIITMNGRPGAMYEPRVSMPGVTWTWGRRWLPKKKTDAEILESEWVADLIQMATKQFPEFAEEV